MTEPVARTVKDFCRAYGVGKSLMYELLAAGKLRAVKAGNRTLILEASANEWLNSLPSATQKASARTHVKTHMHGADGGGQQCP